MHQPRHPFLLLAAALFLGASLTTLDAQEIPESRLLKPSEEPQASDEKSGEESRSDVPPRPTDSRRPQQASDEEGQDVRSRRDRALLEVQLKPAERGVTVTAIRPGGAADKAGIEEGDTLLKIEGEAVANPQDVTNSLRSKTAGDEVAVTVLRDGEEQEIRVTLARAPVQREGRNQERPEQVNRRRVPLNNPGNDPQGTLQSADAEQPFRVEGGWLGLSVEAGGEDINGLRVKRVFPGGPAARAGILKESVLLEIEGQPLSRHEDLAEALKGTQPGQTVAVLVTRGPDPKLNQKTRHVQLGESQQPRAIDEQDPNRGSAGYWEDSQGFATDIPSNAYELEYQRRMAEQNERLERLLISLNEEIQELRGEVAALKADRSGTTTPVESTTTDRQQNQLNPPKKDQ